jgi:hypothetical protein
MRIHTGIGTTPTILVIVVTIGNVRRLGTREPSAALRAGLARAACADLNGIPATGVTAPWEDATGAACLPATRLRECRGSRVACGERPVSAGRDTPPTCGVVAAVVGAAGAGVIVAGAAPVGVAAPERLGMGVRACVDGMAGALPGAADGAARAIGRIAPAVTAA